MTYTPNFAEFLARKKAQECSQTSSIQYQFKKNFNYFKIYFFIILGSHFGIFCLKLKCFWMEQFETLFRNTTALQKNQQCRFRTGATV